MVCLSWSQFPDIVYWDNLYKTEMIGCKPLQDIPYFDSPMQKGSGERVISPRRTTSFGQFLFYRRVRAVTRHLRPVNFYFTDESEPSLVSCRSHPCYYYYSLKARKCQPMIGKFPFCSTVRYSRAVIHSPILYVKFPLCQPEIYTI